MKKPFMTNDEIVDMMTREEEEEEKEGETVTAVLTVGRDMAVCASQLLLSGQKKMVLRTYRFYHK